MMERTNAIILLDPNEFNLQILATPNLTLYVLGIHLSAADRVIYLLE